MNYFFCDIDGVLTTGHKFYDKTGLPFSKTFYDKDFTALKELQTLDFKIFFITGDENINRNVLENRNYQVFISRFEEKNDIIKREFKFANDDKIFSIGDDIFDLGMLKMANVPICPSNAHPMILEYCSKQPNGIITKSRGGYGVIAEFVGLYCKNNNINLNYNKIIEIDRKEKF